MQNDNNDKSPNPPFRMGTPTPVPSMGELMAWHSYIGTLKSFLIETGYYYAHPAPGDRKHERDDDRGR